MTKEERAKRDRDYLIEEYILAPIVLFSFFFMMYVLLIIS